VSLRRRLALMTTSLLVVGYVVFALVSVGVLETTLRGAMESKLNTIAHAASDIVDDDHGRPSVDADDVVQLGDLHGSDEHLGIYDEAGRLIFGEPLPAGRAASGLSVSRTEAIHDGHHLGWVAAWRDATWILMVRRTAILAFVLVGGILAAIAFFFSGLYARAILTPVERIAELAERIETSDLSQRLNATGRDEIGRLCASFDRMLERLQSSFDAERRFVSDASHELRTPLAVVRAETDLALRRDRTPEEYRAALQSIAREATCLEELVDNLLQTMRREATLNIRPVDVAAVGKEVANRLRTAATSFTLDCAAPEMTAYAHRASLERALTAVVHNALTHGGGDVIMTIGVQLEDVIVEVADGGPGFTPDALEHATDRFWRGDAARTRGSTGLGLSIARTLVEAHGGRLTLANGARGGAIVTLNLPRAKNPAVTA